MMNIGVFQLAGQSREFVHPGLSHKKSDIERMRAMINAKMNPWYDSFVVLSNDNNAKYTYAVKGSPSITLIKQPGGDNTYGAISADARAAYLNALMWVLTDDVRHAQKAVEIFNAWKNVTCFEAGGTESLNVGRVGWLLVEAAELIKHTYNGWAPEDMRKFKDMLVHPGYSNTQVPSTIVSEGTFYWRAYMGDPGRHGNQDLFGWRLVLSMGVFLENEIMYDRALRYFSNLKSRPDDLKYASGPPNTSSTPTATNEYFNTYTLYSRANTIEDYGYNGVLPYFIWENGQCQESSRDQDHAILGLGLISSIAEIAWNQGDDVYSIYDSRILKGYEWALRYNVSMSYSFPDQPQPWEPRVETGEFIQRRDRSGRWFSLKPNPFYESNFTSYSRGNFRSDKRPVYEIAMAHYKVRAGLNEDQMLWTKRALDISNTEVGYESSGWSLDHSGWGGLTFHRSAWMAGDPVHFVNGKPVFEMPQAPCVINAVDYDFFSADGQNRTFYDATPDNSGAVYRMDGVDIVADDNGYVVTDIQNGEWLSYTFNVPVDGDYLVVLKHNTNADGAKFRAVIDGDVELDASVPVTTGYENMSLGNIRLTKGAKVLRIFVTGESNVSKLSKIEIQLDPDAPKNIQFSGKLNSSNQAALNWSFENIIPNNLEIFRSTTANFEDAISIASLQNDATNYNDASVNGKVPTYTYWVVCDDAGQQRISEKVSVSWGYFFDDFQDAGVTQWSVVSGTGIVSDGVLNIGYNTSNRAYISRTGGATLHAGNYPILACQIDTPEGTSLAVHNAVSSILGGGSNVYSGVVGNNVYYYDLRTMGFISSSGTKMVPEDSIMTNTLFQIRMTVTNTISSQLHWVGTFRSVEELNQFVTSDKPIKDVSKSIRFSQNGNMMTLLDISEPVDITVYSITGQLVSRQFSSSSQPLLHLPDKGVYIVSVNGKSSSIIFKTIVQ